nr:pif1 [Calliteara abietis nucleopolyhedrovirus]
MYAIVVLITVLLLIICLLATLARALNLAVNDQVAALEPLQRFDNENVPLIEPPSEIYIEGNTHECHKQLTPCTTHADCDICHEGLANCQYFENETVIVFHDADNQQIEFNIKPGESFCLALDRERARSCNPRTGLWLLAESATGFSLLCSCLTPGLVTQFNMYEDCDVAVGCQPFGRIADLNESPLRCVCDDGHVADYDESTRTPYCRPLSVRDVVYDETYFSRAPCQDGFVRVDHPALDQMYRQEFRLPDICVVDPCSVDPISGQRTAGRLEYVENDLGEFRFCNCPARDNVFGVYSPTLSMIGASSAAVSNACIRPFASGNVSSRYVDYKFYWAHPDSTTRSDADVVARVWPETHLSHERYRRIAYSYLTLHPDVTVIGYSLFKFSTAYELIRPDAGNNNAPTFNLAQHLYQRAGRTAEPCFVPGDDGRCIVANSEGCIRRHASGQVWTAETFTNSWCYLSRESVNLRIWSPATRYPRGRYPLALRVNLMFSLNTFTNFVMHIVYGGDSVESGDVDNLAALLNTYSNYSVN